MTDYIKCTDIKKKQQRKPGRWRRKAQTGARGGMNGDKGRSRRIRGSPQSRLPEVGWRKLSLEAEKMKRHLGPGAPRCLASVFRACELLGLWSAKHPPHTLHWARHLLPFGDSMQLHKDGARQVSGLTLLKLLLSLWPMKRQRLHSQGVFRYRCSIAADNAHVNQELDDGLEFRITVGFWSLKKMCVTTPTCRILTQP